MYKHSPISRSTGAAWCGPWTRRGLSAVLAAGCLLLGACHKTTNSAGEAPPASDAKAAENAKSQPAAKKDADAKEDAAEGVTLTPEQVEKLGIATQPAQALDYSAEAAGFGVVVNHESIAQAVAELATAKATERLSRSSLSRNFCSACFRSVMSCPIPMRVPSGNTTRVQEVSRVRPSGARVLKSVHPEGGFRMYCMTRV